MSEPASPVPDVESVSAALRQRSAVQALDEQKLLRLGAGSHQANNVRVVQSHQEAHLKLQLLRAFDLGGCAGGWLVEHHVVYYSPVPDRVRPKIHIQHRSRAAESVEAVAGSLGSVVLISSKRWVQREYTVRRGKTRERGEKSTQQYMRDVNGWAGQTHFAFAVPAPTLCASYTARIHANLAKSQLTAGTHMRYIYIVTPTYKYDI